MTAVEVYDLAFLYAESLFDKPLTRDYYQTAGKWFKAKGGTQEDYSVFWDMVYACTKSRYELMLSDAYCAFPEYPQKKRAKK